ncbi:hypothetical protein Nepgr_012044 [Nepenthes gracilis]|uniref:Uncharacterized protein n=1 Tax=Nepenthes gracilis TaxID=150966 RepID=A0AAD3SFA0_NEPGR|nr:hypothetical protein Nepgr_012044 [Nepenthes gracilis]
MLPPPVSICSRHCIAAPAMHSWQQPLPASHPVDMPCGLAIQSPNSNSHHLEHRELATSVIIYIMEASTVPIILTRLA